MSKQCSPVTISDTEMHLLSPSNTGRDYRIHVALSPGDAGSDTTYPTLCATDANLGFATSLRAKVFAGAGSFELELLVASVRRMTGVLLSTS